MSSEKRSLYRFIFFYTASTMAILIAFSVLFFEYQKRVFIDSQKQALKLNADNIVLLIKQGDIDKIGTIKGIKYALYNGRREFLGGTYQPKVSKWQLDMKKVGNALEMVYLLPPPHPNHIAYLVIKKSIDFSIINSLVIKIVIALIVILILLLVVGYYLGLLFVKPMRDTIEQLNQFTQDATHELNTPIATILNNIEMIEILNKCQNIKELNRIKVASKTLSKIYEDLSYIKLNSNIQRDIEEVNLSKLLQERLEYFKLLMDSKKLKLITKIEPNITLMVDKRDLIRVFDNLISNAIKYNKTAGSIEVVLSKDSFIIKDSGIGIKKEHLKEIFNRFKRANKSEGGFGIGLNIVDKIVKSYGYKLEIDSILDKGTTITILWSKQ